MIEDLGLQLRSLIGVFVFLAIACDSLDQAAELTAAEEADAKLVLADKAKEVYEQTEKAHKGKDFSVVYQWLTGKS